VFHQDREGNPPWGVAATRGKAYKPGVRRSILNLGRSGFDGCEPLDPFSFLVTSVAGWMRVYLIRLNGPTIAYPKPTRMTVRFVLDRDQSEQENLRRFG
jgi:hypothetical protein